MPHTRFRADPSLADAARAELNNAPGTEPASAQAARALRMRTARREITERRRITQRLRAALATGGFTLQYQPLVSLRSGLVRGAETLIRLQHNRRGFIPANYFLPIAERSDVITDVGGWMLHHACADSIETEPQFNLLCAIGCDEGQGSYFSQPVQAAEISTMLPAR
jgi:EAL domain-containing protein (putative c-di-GMP-specific phosphodiesterase class I)